MKIENFGFADDIAECKSKLKKLEQEETKLKSQLDKAFNLVEQGVYSLEVFKERQYKLMVSLDELREEIIKVQEVLAQYEESEAGNKNLIPQTEELLECYDEMTVEERNNLLKAILEKIEYYKGQDGKVEIDLYPKLPKL